MELDELKKSWNALDEHLKDKEFLNEEGICRLTSHTRKSINSLARLNMKLILISLPLLAIISIGLFESDHFDLPYLILIIIALPALVWDIFTARYLRATKVDEMALVEVIERINKVKRWIIREQIIGIILSLFFTIFSFIHWQVWNRGVLAIIIFIILWSGCIALIRWIYQSKLMKRIKEIKKNLDELEELTI